MSTRNTRSARSSEVCPVGKASSRQLPQQGQNSQALMGQNEEYELKERLLAHLLLISQSASLLSQTIRALLARMRKMNRSGKRRGAEFLVWSFTACMNIIMSSKHIPLDMFDEILKRVLETFCHISCQSPVGKYLAVYSLREIKRWCRAGLNIRQGVYMQMILDLPQSMPEPSRPLIVV